MEQEKMLKMMRFWLFGTFVIVFASVTVFAAIAGAGLAILMQPNYWIGVAIAAAACVGAYFGYRWWLNRGK